MQLLCVDVQTSDEEQKRHSQIKSWHVRGLNDFNVLWSWSITDLKCLQIDTRYHKEVHFLFCIYTMFKEDNWTMTKPNRTMTKPICQNNLEQEQANETLSLFASHQQMWKMRIPQAGVGDTKFKKIYCKK